MLPTTINQIRILPMSDEDPEFIGFSINQLQEWFVSDLPFRPYRFKSGLKTDSGSLILFQFKSRLIAGAILAETYYYDQVEEGYRGHFEFKPETIMVYSPIDLDEAKQIWPNLKKFGNSKQKLDADKYDDLLKLLLEKKGVTYALDSNSDDETFYQYRIEKILPSNFIIVDEPVKKPKQANLHSTKWSRNALTAKRSIISSNYCCEVDGNHQFFISQVSGKNYVEAHHLIPMESQDRFQYSLDVEANIVSLCVVCHKAIHHADHQKRIELIKTLYNKRIERLKNCRIEISLKDLTKCYL